MKGSLDPGQAFYALSLSGTSTGAGILIITRVALGESYRFEGVPVGSYRLIGAAAGQRLWDLTLAVEDGRQVVLDLGKDNSSNPTVALYQ